MKIFLDMDGVITDFVIPAMAKCEAEINEAEYPATCKWNILSAINQVRTDKGLKPIGKKRFWDSLNYDFWRRLKMYTGVMEFISKLEKVGEVFIATSPTLSSDCVAAKYDWIIGNLPDYRRKLFICTMKEQLASPEAILIDDRDQNCIKFDKSGGHGILLNRPWNQGGYSLDPYQEVLNEIDKIKQK